MDAIQKTYPKLTTKMSLTKFSKIVALFYCINTKRGNWGLLKIAELLGQEREEFYVRLSRGFAPTEDFMSKFRWQNHVGSLAFIYERMIHFNSDDHVLQVKPFELSNQEFDKAGLYCPGRAIKDRSYWLFPMILPNKMLYIEGFLKRGINAYRGAT